jgi:glycerol kinase
MGYILAVDQGTSSTTALLMDELGNIKSVASAQLPQIYPQPGWVEHSGAEIKKAVMLSINQALSQANITNTEILGIGITNQRETLCIFDHDSEPLRNFIVWQCRRSTDLCEKLKSQDLEDFLHKRTGLLLDPYFSASKISWLFEHEPALKKAAQNNQLLVGTVDSFLVHWLSGGLSHVTDVSNASRTMLMNLITCDYDDDCLNIFGVPKVCLPKINKNIGNFGVTKNLNFLPDGIPIVALAGDQQAALFGQCCFDPGDAKATFGTGCFILLNTGSKPIFSNHGMLTSVAFQIDTQAIYCLEGSAFIAGAATQFLIDAFALIKSPHDLEALARSVENNGGVTFVPALCGLGAPHWRPQARGSLSGLSRATTKGHIARATLEGIALQNLDIFDAMAQDAPPLTQLKVDGGASVNNLLIQLHADLLGIPCLRSLNFDKTALGVAYMAALALGIFENLEAIKKLDKNLEIFVPALDKSWTKASIAAYRQAVERL